MIKMINDEGGKGRVSHRVIHHLNKQNADNTIFSLLNTLLLKEKEVKRRKNHL